MVNLTDILKSSRISLHTDTPQAFVGEKKVDLTKTEFNLLACLLKSGGASLSRDVLLSIVWGESYLGTERTVDTHIHRLRSKLGKAGNLIRAVRGVGDRLEN